MPSALTSFSSLPRQRRRFPQARGREDPPSAQANFRDETLPTCYRSAVKTADPPLSLELSPSVIEAIAQRVAPMVAELIVREGSTSESEFLSVEEAADLMRSTPGRVRNLITAGQLVPDAYNGRRPLLSRVQVRAWMRTIDTLAPAEQLRRRAA